LSHFLCQ